MAKNSINLKRHHGEIVRGFTEYCIETFRTPSTQLREWLTSGFPKSLRYINKEEYTVARKVLIKKNDYIPYRRKIKKRLYLEDTFEFGKYKDQTIESICVSDIKYIIWYLKKKSMEASRAVRHQIKYRTNENK